MALENGTEQRSQACERDLDSFWKNINWRFHLSGVFTGPATRGVPNRKVPGDLAPYVALTSSGIKKEGESFSAFFPTPEKAAEAFMEEFGNYRGLNPKSSYCFVRSAPQLECNPARGWVVYSRILLAGDDYLDLSVSEQAAMLTPPGCLVQTVPAYLTPGWRSQRKGPNLDNKSGFRATGHRILLIPDVVEKKTASGIVLVEKTVIAEENIAVEATVLEIGPDAWSDKSTDYCEVGDRVLVGQYVGKLHTSPIDGKRYRFVQDLDIISPIVGEPQ